ncbi:AAA family ATPase [Arthrobacter sp. ISL-5]|uniref:AAA family ATPase n=1 Tax=Arthrobacter sp. ISL-5 TaxID=2819111 RepID=UPI001BEB175B|nr:AAA family ATPase [Arthrobacter sp. ISL-5]MBT2554439.1 AAA family ATPase [Arthrobacter sp. ISL-5]
MQPVNDHPSVLSKLAKTNHIHLQRLSIFSSPAFTPQDVHFARFTAVVGSHGSGKSYLLKILEESLPKYGGEHMRFPPASRSRWKDADRADVGAVAGTHSINMGSGWTPQNFRVDLRRPRAESFIFGESDGELRVTVPLSAHRAFADYEMWMQDVEAPDHARHFEGSWAADRPTLTSINRILGREYGSVEFFAFKSDSYDAPYLEATMSDGHVRTPYEMSSGELWVLYCIWELERSAASDIVLIDEPESYLSPRGHVAFLDEIARRTLAGGFQTIIATLSEAMIRRLPIDLLRFAVRGANGVVIRDDVSHDEVMVAAIAHTEGMVHQRVFLEIAEYLGLDHAFVRRTLIASWLNGVDVREQAREMVSGMEKAVVQLL